MGLRSFILVLLGMLCIHGNLFAAYDTSNNVIERVVQTSSMELLAIENAQGTFYLHQDRLGNVTHLTDSTGNLVESYRYDAFGTRSVFDASGSALPASSVNNRFGYTGQEHLSTANLVDLRNRFYSPALGRFINRDPIEEAGGINLYAYVGNDVVNYWDSFGYSKQDGNQRQDQFRNMTDEEVKKELENNKNDKTKKERLIGAN